MKNISNIYILLLFLLINILPFSAKGQNSIVDSFKTELRKANNDTARITLLISLVENINCNDTIASLNYGKQALQLAEKNNWERGLVNVDNCLGSIYENCLKNYSLAVEYFQKSEFLAKKINDRKTEAWILRDLGNIYKETEQYTISIQFYQKSIDVETEPEDMVGTFATMGTIYSNLGDYTNALKYYQQALSTLDNYQRKSKNNSDVDKRMFCGLLITTGDIYLATSQYDQALSNYDSVLKITFRIKGKDNNALLKTWALKSIGHLYQLKKDYDNAIKNYNKALEVAASGQSDEAEILNALGAIYFAKGEDAKAMDYTERSRKVFEKIVATNKSYDDATGLPDNYITLGKIYAGNKKYYDAISYLQKALDVSKQTEALDKQSDAWLELSDVYGQMKDSVKAYSAYRNYITTRDSVFSIDKAKEITRMQMQGEINKQQLSMQIKLEKQRLFTYSGMLGICIVVLISFFVFRNYNREKRVNSIIQAEKEKSDVLLLNILPAEVADELKTKGSVQAKEFENVSVLFTDFVNFTAAGERLGAQQLVAELDTCFVAFDQIIAKYNIEKIKTVGDAYLAVSGLPLANPNHASDMVKAAIEIRDHMLKRRAELGDKTFELRIGIHSGPVVAGIVGVKKFAYDIWGDTVNIAARMEQSGEAGKVNVSDATYELLKNKFSFTYRGEIDAKNKGRLKMYFVS